HRRHRRDRGLRRRGCPIDPLVAGILARGSRQPGRVAEQAPGAAAHLTGAAAHLTGAAAHLTGAALEPAPPRCRVVWAVLSIVTVMDLGLRGRTALVCASTAGLGRATAEALAAEGARVVI